MSNRMELLDLEAAVTDLDDVKGGIFLPSRFPFRSSMANSGESSDLASRFFDENNMELPVGTIVGEA